MTNNTGIQAMNYPVGVSDFKEIVSGHYTFVDKSLFIKDVLDDSAKVILITRPRRFGKTLNMSMLRYFFDKINADENRKFFEHLAIAQAKTRFGRACFESQGMYPVIFLSLKDIKASSYADAYQNITRLMSRVYQEHRYLLDSDVLFPEDKQMIGAMIREEASPSHVKYALGSLSRYLSLHHNAKAIVLIDEYDTPIHAAYLSTPRYHDEMLEFMRGFLGEALKDNEFLHKGVVTGILRIAQANLFSDLNNIDVYTLLRRDYTQYFGFTPDEVKKLVLDSGLPVKLDAIQSWYNGYQIGDTVLYNPWSMLCCLKQQGHLQSYWIETGEAGLLGVALRKQSIHVKLQLQQLMEGETIEVKLDYRTSLLDIERSSVSVWTLLVFSGYLNARPTHFGDDGEITCQVSIPNREVSGAYARFVKSWYQHALNDDYKTLLEALIHGRVEQFQALLQTYIEQSLSYFDLGKKTPEKIYHVFILGLLAGLRSEYLIQSNKEAGYGRFDLALVPHDATKLGIMMEFKSVDEHDDLDASAQGALNQIKQHHYTSLLQQHGIKKQLALGIAFSGKQVVVRADGAIT
ncbi:MAG: AAA family ATPase [Legionellaceae bacterium]|nr:AAA family ATPase [Legionellaceae bacterium]